MLVLFPCLGWESLQCFCEDRMVPPTKGSIGIVIVMGNSTLWPSPSAACVALAYEVDRGYLIDFRARVARTRDKQYPLSSPNPFHCPERMINRIFTYHITSLLDPPSTASRGKTPVLLLLSFEKNIITSTVVLDQCYD